MTNRTLVSPKRHKPCDVMDDTFLDFLFSASPLWLGAIVCSIDTNQAIPYYVKYVTHQH